MIAEDEFAVHISSSMRLVDMVSGEFLLMTDLTKRTRDPRWAWMGNERQAHVVRARFPHSRSMVLQRVKPTNNKSRN